MVSFCPAQDDWNRQAAKAFPLSFTGGMYVDAEGGRAREHITIIHNDEPGFTPAKPGRAVAEHTIS